MADEGSSWTAKVAAVGAWIWDKAKLVPPLVWSHLAAFAVGGLFAKWFL
jgi:hypothetical protein